MVAAGVGRNRLLQQRSTMRRSAAERAALETKRLLSNIFSPDVLEPAFVRDFALFRRFTSVAPDEIEPLTTPELDAATANIALVVARECGIDTDANDGLAPEDEEVQRRIARQVRRDVERFRILQPLRRWD